MELNPSSPTPGSMCWVPMDTGGLLKGNVTAGSYWFSLMNTAKLLSGNLFFHH